MEVFVLPTNRDISIGAESAILEIRAARKRFKRDIPLIIVDNSKDDTLARNLSFEEEENKKGNVKILHFDIQKQEDIIRQISIESHIDFEELRSLLLPVGIDYGKIANMIYIIATMLDADTLIRRDSDCFVEDLPEDEYPIIKELEYLGQSIDEVEDLANKSLAKTFLNKEMLIVGGDYYGEWNLDLKEFAQIDKEFVKTLVALNDVDYKYTDDYVSVKYSSNLDKKPERPLLYSPFNTELSDIFTKADTYRYPECGNISMKRIFQWFPDFIGQSGIGFDYNTQHMCTVLKIPMLYHTNKIRHAYHKGRKDGDSLKRYWKGMIKQYDISTLTVMCEGELKKHKELYESSIEEQIDKIAFQLVPDTFEKCFHSMNKNQRLKKMDILIDDVLLASKIEAYKAIAEYLHNERENILKELDEDYRQSIRVQRLWKDIISAAKKLSIGRNSL